MSNEQNTTQLSGCELTELRQHNKLLEGKLVELANLLGKLSEDNSALENQLGNCLMMYELQKAATLRLVTENDSRRIQEILEVKSESVDSEIPEIIALLKRAIKQELKKQQILGNTNGAVFVRKLLFEVLKDDSLGIETEKRLQLQQIFAEADSAISLRLDSRNAK